MGGVAAKKGLWWCRLAPMALRISRMPPLRRQLRPALHRQLLGQPPGQPRARLRLTQLAVEAAAVDMDAVAAVAETKVALEQTHRRLPIARPALVAEVSEGLAAAKAQSTAVV